MTVIDATAKQQLSITDELKSRALEGYYTWLHENAVIGDREAAYLAGYKQGGRDVLRATAQLAEMVPTMRRIIAWLDAEDAV